MYLQAHTNFYCMSCCQYLYFNFGRFSRQNRSFSKFSGSKELLLSFRDHPFSTYARRGGRGVAKCVRNCTGGRGGVSPKAYVLFRLYQACFLCTGQKNSSGKKTQTSEKTCIFEKNSFFYPARLYQAQQSRYFLVNNVMHEG